MTSPVNQCFLQPAFGYVQVPAARSHDSSPGERAQAKTSPLPDPDPHGREVARLHPRSRRRTGMALTEIQLAMIPVYTPTPSSMDDHREENRVAVNARLGLAIGCITIKSLNLQRRRPCSRIGNDKRPWLRRFGSRFGPRCDRSREVPLTERSCSLKLTARRAAACGPPRRNSMEHSLYAYVFVNLRPAYPRTASDDLESCTLLRSCLGESPGPRQRNTNRPAVQQLGSNRVLSDRNSLTSLQTASRLIAISVRI